MKEPRSDDPPPKKPSLWREVVGRGTMIALGGALMWAGVALIRREVLQLIAVLLMLVGAAIAFFGCLPTSVMEKTIGPPPRSSTGLGGGANDWSWLGELLDGFLWW